jgi:surfactin synthase thioesterase subunit
MLRSDLELVESYTNPAGPILSCPVIAMGGSHDPDTVPEELAGWRTVTAGPFRSMLFPGDHFFINSSRMTVLQAIQRELAVLGLQ